MRVAVGAVAGLVESLTSAVASSLLITGTVPVPVCNGMYKTGKKN